ncbi:MAG: 3-hydroxyacyl-CoA dehydrogenase [Devosia sp.]
MKTVIVGAGMIGRAWAISFARAGHDVVLWNKTPARCAEAKQYIASVLPVLADKDLLSGRTEAQVLSRISSEEDLSKALSGAGYVQENAAETIPVKREIFGVMDAAAPRDAILASSTSGIVPSAFTDHLAGRDRCVVAHPLNPPYLVPAVDVVPSPWTSPDVLERTAAFLKSCGQTPIMMKKEDPGFLTIRLQGAIYHEAWRLVSSGLAAPEDVDIAIREGLALRWSFIGPFETADLNAPGGIRDFVGRYGELYQQLYPAGVPVRWEGELMDYVESERRERLPMTEHKSRQLWRDKRLMALAVHKAAAARADAE